MNNDLISRAAAIDALTDKNLKRNVDSVCDGDMNRTRRAAQRVIAQVPAIDAVPVVRCKNCKYWEPDQAPLDEIVDNHPCQYYNVWRAPDDYCSCGEAIDDAPTCGPDYCEIGGEDDADG